MTDKDSSDRLFDLLGEVKLLAKEYFQLTTKPLGVTGEIAEHEAARLLDLELSSARQPGFDATRPTQTGEDQHLQIKGRRLTPGSKPSQRVPTINLEKDWDAALLVLLNEDYEPVEIHEADRSAIELALTAPGSTARNQRGQLSVSKFKSIGCRVWSASDVK